MNRIYIQEKLPDDLLSFLHDVKSYFDDNDERVMIPSDDLVQNKSGSISGGLSDQDSNRFDVYYYPFWDKLRICWHIAVKVNEIERIIKEKSFGIYKCPNEFCLGAYSNDDGYCLHCEFWEKWNRPDFSDSCKVTTIDEWKALFTAHNPGADEISIRTAYRYSHLLILKCGSLGY